MSAAPSPRAARGTATVSRLLAAAIGILRDEGAAAVSIQRVANAAGTSKGLVHYHFADKDALLTACAELLTAQLVEQEALALALSSATSALDDLWRVVTSAENHGRRRALLALSTGTALGTRTALSDSTMLRQRSAVRTVDALQHLLHFDVRMSRSALALAFQALLDGLALDAHGPMTAQHRQAYDAFWLAVLSLTG